MTLEITTEPWAFGAVAQKEPLGAGDAKPDGESEKALVDYCKKVLWPAYESERLRMRVIDMWLRNEQTGQRLPNGATPELRNLLALSKTPWLGLVVTTLAQTMYVDGYRSPAQRGNVPGPWKTWHANQFDVRQLAIHRAAIGYGYTYETVLPGKTLKGERQAVMRGVSPKSMYAVYEDPGADEWPVYAMQVKPQRGGTLLVYLYDSVHRHPITVKGEKWRYAGEPEEHGAGVCPVVRFCNALDLDGWTPGEVETFISVASRIDKTTFDRLTTQHYNSWKVRTVTGMQDFANSEEEANVKKLKLRQQDLLVAEDPDTKFGVLDETNLDGFISATGSDIEALAAVSQVPSHLLTGKLVNLSAEALAAARANVTQKAYERKVAFGAAHSQALRLGAALQGDAAAAEDVLARVTWQNVEVRSLAQAVDALGKIASQLGVPKQALWRLIPDVTALDVEDWTKMLLSNDPVSEFLRQFDGKAGADQLPDAPRSM